LFKKLFFVLGTIAAVVLIILTVAVVVVYTKIDKTYISAQMADALNRQVYVEKLNVSIFSIVSGVEFSNITVSNFKTKQELQKLQGSPVSPADVFFSAEALFFKVKIPALLKRQVELRELVLFKPVLNLLGDRQGILNIDDLLKSGKRSADKEKKEPLGQPRLISLDDLPAALSIGEIGLKNGTINYTDCRFDQEAQIYNLTALAHDLKIDPRDLARKNEIKLKVETGIKTVGPMKTGSVQNFDFKISASGKIIPFDLQTRELDPEVILHVAVPDGEITGLQVFNSIASIPILGEYLSEQISFLKRKQQWKNSNQAGFDLRYKAGRAKLDNGKLAVREAEFLFDGEVNLESNELDVNLSMAMEKEINEAVKDSLDGKLEILFKSPDLKKYADTRKLAQIALAPLLNKDGKINLKAKVAGTTNKPDVRIIAPKLNSLNSVVKDMAGGLSVEIGRSAAKKNLKDDQQQMLNKAEEFFKRK